MMVSSHIRRPGPMTVLSMVGGVPNFARRKTPCFQWRLYVPTRTVGCDTIRSGLITGEKSGYDSTGLKKSHQKDFRWGCGHPASVCAAAEPKLWGFNILSQAEVGWGGGNRVFWANDSDQSGGWEFPQDGCEKYGRILAFKMQETFTGGSGGKFLGFR